MTNSETEHYDKFKQTLEKLQIGKGFYFLLRGNTQIRINISRVVLTYPNGVGYPVDIIGIFPDDSCIYTTSADSLYSTIEKIQAAILHYYGLNLKYNISYVQSPSIIGKG